MINRVKVTVVMAMRVVSHMTLAKSGCEVMRPYTPRPYLSFPTLMLYSNAEMTGIKK
ncbi:hypothetical protein GALL_485870 [mine drainage metagenome]|uniref:Uncharacterized protein n=1 Tax=mine drainage metagenome TaxID=410659 RepID=A0A1J5PG99_9ZZZZ